MRVHGIVRRLTKEEKGLVRQAGAQLFAQQKRQTPNHNVPEQSCQSPDSSQLRSSESQAAGEDGSSGRSATQSEPLLTPCIVVATTPPHASDDNQFTPVVPRSLRVFQANVGKILRRMTPLALADSERYDIILLQEPWTGLKDGRCLTKTHPAYDTFSPVTDWDGRDTRPRVMTYVRRSAGLVADQKRPAATRDILWLTVNGTTVVNFYRQPDYDAALEILLGWCVTDKCLVSGDFNAKHPSWQAGRQEHRGEDIAFWAMDNRLSLLNAVDVPTNARGSTIDLAFSNIPLADAVVEDHLATGSDHFTLNPPQPDEELKRFVELVEAGAAFIPTTTSTPSELDNFASALVDLLGCAARAAGRPVRKTTHGARWWNEECAKAAANYRAWRRVYPLGFDREVQLAKRELHNAVRRAKRLYWRDLIDSFADGDSVFRAVRWLKSSGPCQAPPLQVDGRVYETQLEKATALRRATLERRTASDDIPDPWIPVNTDKMIPFPNQVSFEEARDATLRTGNTSPGSDNITVRMLRAVWHAIGSLVHQLYQGCLRIGHHPKPFREAEVVMIAKLGRRDLSTPRAWRPISLLSCLGKGLERLIARRLAWAQSTSAYYTHNKPARSRRGWPSNLARWAGSFMQDRSARIRYQDIVTDSSPSSAGRFGYADDTAILCVGNSLDETTAEASHHETDEHETWPLPSAMRRAVCACVIPVLLYAAEAWYPGPKSPRWTKPSKEGPSGIGNLVKKMSKALYTSLRAILPVWRTTPTNVLHREAGIPPVPLLLEGRRTAFAARLKALDEAHPLVQRTSRPKAPVVTVNKLIKLKYQKQPQPFRTRLRRADEMLSSCPRPALLQRGFAEEQTAPLQSASKHETAKKFRDWLQALSPRTLVVYSDGSRSEEGHIGYGYAVHRDGSTVLSGKGRLGTAEVFDAEAKGSLPETDRIFVCLDNLATATCLRGTPNDSSQEVFLSSNLWRENTELWRSIGSPAMLTSQATRRLMLWQRQSITARTR
ncbi:endonuclease-reverse transcriptase domain-containing protein [Hirsutella rhossiliensis]|uniref:Endonuclease-reverse transcriptase domain-containing protein n=1 Tax=Hirsutella rhossiliensis TaxID=111463 RepID=A0A9P8SCL7_9HYPO|nr:endonuclease-reverse transcriptase domain-containing protein [Hirsutella rhossiliensis]KAH0957768.1 endonuclease-reverse transcriptase domain-containing protein [Hirsutella rhossiliensis]